MCVTKVKASHLWPSYRITLSFPLIRLSVLLMISRETRGEGGALAEAGFREPGEGDGRHGSRESVGSQRPRPPQASDECVAGV